MPLLGKEEFKRLPPPHGLKPDIHVYYLKQSGEVFVDYNSYFERLMQLNSMVWTCSATRRTGLTFEEALESERTASPSTKFPQPLELAIMYLVQRFSKRYGIDDLVNDIYEVLRERYFINEPVFFGGKFKRVARIIGVHYEPKEAPNGTMENGQEVEDEHEVDEVPSQNGIEGGESSKTPQRLKVPKIPSPHNFVYTLRVYKGKTSLDDLDESVDTQLVEDVDHESIMRSKKFASRAKIKDLLKSVVDANADGKLFIQNGIVSTTRLDKLEWEEVFAGPLPEFPQRKNRRINKKDADTPRGRASKGNAAAHRSPKRRDSGGGSPSKKGKAREELLIKIKAQQEELQQTFEKAERLGMQGLDRWRQNDKLLKPADLEALTSAISSARLESREKAREKRLREREEQLMWKKPRDDLLCDDLESLPDLRPIQFPEWFAPEMFGDLLSVQNFLHGFSDAIEGDGSAKYSFPELVKAVMEPSAPTSRFLDIVTKLLQIRTKCADDEDGDEADIDNPEEVGWNDLNCELDHPVHGSRIRDINKLHETLRCAFGRSVRHLPVDRKTVTEVLRLTLETSGYYLVYNNPRRGRNLGARGGNKCYEDAGFQFVTEHRDIIDKLRETTVFEITPRDRVTIISVVVQQLLSYMKFRVEIDARLDNMYQRRREFKQLRIRDVQQEKDAKDARLAQEFHQDKVRELGEEEALKLKLWQPKKPGKVTQKLLAYVKAVNEGRRVTNAEEIKELCLACNIVYDEMAPECIVEVREVQRRIVEGALRLRKMKLHEAYGSLGMCYLGRDRVYRSYFYVHHLSMLLVECPAEDEVPPCDRPTPIRRSEERCFDEDDVKSEQDDATNDVAEWARRSGCSGDPNSCVAHNFSKNHSKWSDITDGDTLDKLIAACNPRGLREMELADTLASVKDIFTSSLESLPKSKETGEVLHDILFGLHVKPEVDVPSVSQSFMEQVRKEILDFEEKISSKAYGRIRCTATSRSEWRQALLEKGDSAKFCVENVVRLEHSPERSVVFTAEDLASLSEVKKLCVALFQVSDGISIDCFRPPFSQEEKDDEGPYFVPTTSLIHWQTGLLQCQSASALALYLSVIQEAIAWPHLDARTPKCNRCRMKLDDRKPYLRCVECELCYHNACLKEAETSERAYVDGWSWKCNRCAALEALQDAKANGHANGVHENGCVNGREHSNDGSSQSQENGDSSRTRRSKRSVDYVYEDSDDGDARSRRKRRVVEKVATRAAAGLRTADSKAKEQFHECEKLLRECIAQPFGQPFAAPVPREVPQYYDIIKRPMDMRTMITKLKRLEYPSPVDVWLDACLVLDNCHFFNEDDSEVAQCANELEAFMTPRLEDILGVTLSRTNKEASVEVKNGKGDGRLELSDGEGTSQAEE